MGFPKASSPRGWFPPRPYSNLFLLVLLILGIFAGTLAAQTQPASKSSKPDVLQQHYDAARTYGLSGDSAHADLEYKAFLAEALRRMANVQTSIGDFKVAGDYLDQAISFAPEDSGLLRDRAQVYLSDGKLDEAGTFARKAQRPGATDAKTEYLLGRISMEKGDYKAAKEHLERAIVTAQTVEIGYSLGTTYLKLNDLTRARQLFTEMILGLGDTPGLRLLIAKAYRETQFWDQAIEELKNTVTKYPKAAQVHYFLALAYMGRDEDAGIPQAVPEFRAELENQPDDARSQYMLGYALLKQHDQKGAEVALQRAAVLDPQNADPWVYLGQLYSDSGRKPEAEAALRKAIAISKTGSASIDRAHYVLARILLDTGRREEGLKELEVFEKLRKERLQQQVMKQQASDAPDLKKAADTMPEAASSSEDRKKAQAYRDQLAPAVADAYNNLGVNAAGRKDFAAAAADFQEAAKWNPTLETIDRNWGMAAFYGGQYQDAIAPLERQLQRKADDTRARAALGFSYFFVENYRKTLETLNPIEAEMNSDAGLASAYALSLVKVGSYDDGTARLKVLAAANPDSADVHVSLGEAFAEQKIFATAIEEFRKALVIDSSQGRTHFLLGLALIHQGDNSGAVPELRTALKLNPSDQTAKYHLAFALLQTQQKDEAKQLLTQVVEQNPNHADAYYQLGKLQLEQGDVKQAISSLETASKISPESDYVHYQLAMAYRRDSRSDDAARELKLYQDLKDRRRGNHEGQPESN